MRTLRGAAVLAAALLACDTGDPNVDNAAVIVGTVVDVETGTPLEGVVIETTPATERVETDQAGTYTIANGPKLATFYQVTAKIDGYDTVTKTINTSPTEENRVDFGLTILKACTPGETRCAIGVEEEGTETCSARGNRWEAFEACSEQQVCVDATGTCVPGFALTVSTVGAGSGAVVSSPGGINCGASCEASFVEGTVVALTASTIGQSAFGGWTGACSGTETTCEVTMDAAKEVTAQFTPTGYTLTVETEGLGSGRVRSTPAGINCGAGSVARGICTAPFELDATVTLTATLEPGSTFGGWSGPCTGTGDCTVTIDQMRTVTARFDTTTYVLTVTKGGTGAGNVMSAPAGIDCGAACSAEFVENEMVTLTASAAPSSDFLGWGGACTGTQLDCVVTMDQAQDVTADFDGVAHPVTVTLMGNGSGTVVSVPSGIDCGNVCSAAYGPGTNLTLTATPDAANDFAGWGGDCAAAGTDPTCMVTVDGPLNVSAQFDVGTVDLSVTVNGNGVVTSNPVGIDCGATCMATFAGGTQVTLTAGAQGTDVFGGWGGDCAAADTSPTCMITLNANSTVNALFEPFFMRPLPGGGSCLARFSFDAGSLVNACGGPDAVASGMWTQITSRSTALGDAMRAAVDEEGYIATNESAPAPGAATIEMTVRKAGAAFGGRTRAVLYGDLDALAPGPGVRMLVLNDGSLAIQTYDGAGTTTATAAAALADNTWAHVAATISTTNGLKLFVDGVEVAQNPAPALWTASSSTAWVGAEREGAGGAIYRFNGDIDEVRISDAVLY